MTQQGKNAIEIIKAVRELEYFTTKTSAKHNRDTLLNGKLHYQPNA